MTVEAPRFSIATPARNSLDKLRRCVGSVRGQTGVRFEHLVQDAASADGSGNWLAEQAAKRSDLRPMSEPDSGMYDAINRAWARSQGSYLSWLNADEQYLPGTLARVQSYFEAHPEVDAVFADYLVVDAQGRAVALRRFYVANSFLNAQSCTMFFRRRLWDRGLLTLDHRLRYAADKALVLGLMDAGVRIDHLPEVLSLFGIDGSNLSTHPAMEAEAERIRLAHGAFRWRALRGLALGARRAERMLRGAYRARDFRYQYALDETPHYVAFQARGLGGRYSLADVEGRARAIGPAGDDDCQERA